MAIVLHPLSAVDGKPSYTASDFRLVNNSFVIPSNGSPFDGISGVRMGAPEPLCDIDGMTVTVHPHAGTVSPWTGVGAYTYYIAEDTTVSVANSSGSFKIVVSISDPSASHGTTGQAVLSSVDGATSDSDIDGLVIATVTGGVISDAAPIIQPSATVIARTKTQLDSLSATKGQSARLSDGTEYTYDGSAWVSVSQPVTAQVQFGWSNSNFTLVKRNGIVTTNGQMSLSGNVAAMTNTALSQVIPTGFRPVDHGTILLIGNNGQTQEYLIGADGKITLSSSGANTGYFFTFSGSWVAA